MCRPPQPRAIACCVRLRSRLCCYVLNNSPTIGSSSIPMQEGGILKRQPSSPLKTLKSFTKVLSKAEYLAQLRNMLPKTNGQNEEMSEVSNYGSTYKCDKDNSPAIAQSILRFHLRFTVSFVTVGTRGTNDRIYRIP